MKAFGVVVGTFNWFVSLVCGLMGVLWFIEGEQPGFLKEATEYRWLGMTIFLVAMAAVLLNIAWLVVRHIWAGGPAHVPVAGADSDVMVAVSAVQKALTKTLENEPEVHDAEVELTHDKVAQRITKVVAHGTIWDGPDALQTSLKIRHLLEKRLMEIVQPDVMPEFEVKLDSFRFVHKGKKPKHSSRVDQVTKTFRGPEYPIDRKSGRH